MKKKLTAIIPCYLDAQAIPIMHDRLVKTFKKIKLDYEIIFINDNSPDNTQQVLDNICQLDEKIIAITHSKSFGGMGGVINGMQIASGDGVVILDGDLQDPPELIENFVEKWIEGYDVVYGVRVRREMKIYKEALHKLFYRLFNFMSYTKIPVDAGGFSLIDKKVVYHLLQFPETDYWIQGLRAWVGFKQIGVDYVRPERMFGRSTNNWISLIWWAKKAIFSFSFQPLAIINIAGIIITFLSFIGILIQIYFKISNPDGAPQGYTTLAVLILFFGGINLLALSFIGEYISKIFEETKKRPRFITKEITVGNKKYSSIEDIKSFIDKRSIIK